MQGTKAHRSNLEHILLLLLSVIVVRILTASSNDHCMYQMSVSRLWFTMPSEPPWHCCAAQEKQYSWPECDGALVTLWLGSRCSSWASVLECSSQQQVCDQPVNPTVQSVRLRQGNRSARSATGWMVQTIDACRTCAGHQHRLTIGFLPSSFAMYGVLFAFGCWFNDRYASAIAAAAAATILRMLHHKQRVI
jgi:hypothetical protein